MKEQISERGSAFFGQVFVLMIYFKYMKDHIKTIEIGSDISDVRTDDEYVKKLDEAVKRARINKKWRTEFMIINMRDREHEYIGRMKGIEEYKRAQITEMLKDGKTPEEISAFCKYPMELIEEVQKNMMAETVK